MESVNLIDLSIMDDGPSSTSGTLIDLNNTRDDSLTNRKAVPYKKVAAIPQALVSTTLRRFGSIDQCDNIADNPFDNIQKLSTRPDDPFDIVEREANRKAKEVLTSAEVKVERLLSISDDSVLVDDTCCHPAPTTYNVDTMHRSDIAETIISLDSWKQTPESGSTTESSNSSSGSSVMGRKIKTSKDRKHLLKLSLTNATLNSPLNKRLQRSDDAVCYHENSEVCSAFSEAAETCDDMLSSESPVKFVDDDDLLFEETNENHLDAQLDADLAQLNIPILKELHSTIIEKSTENSSIPHENTKKNGKALGEEAEAEVVKTLDASIDDGPLSSVEELKMKLKCKREMFTKDRNIKDVLNNLKSLLSDINGSDTVKKQEASRLLEILSSTLQSTKKSSIPEKDGGEHVVTPPKPPIVRQGTFNLDLNDQERIVTDATMKGSSSSHDDKTADDNDNFVLPEIETPPSGTSSSQVDVANLLQRITQMLDQQQLNNEWHDNDDTTTKPTPSVNSTVIVVMNTSHGAQNGSNALNESHTNEQRHHDGCSKGHVMRPRSQSLCIDDKIRFIQMDVQPAPATDTLLENGSQELPVCTPPLNSKGFPCSSGSSSSSSSATNTNTTANINVRRSSFSSTLYTAVGATKGKIINEVRPSLALHRAKILSIHQTEKQHQMEICNLKLSKPDIGLRKRLKAITTPSSASILKSVGPLKATVPIRKMAPVARLTATATATPKFDSNSNYRDGISVASRPTYATPLTRKTSTPMSHRRSLANLELSAVHGSAKSTPTANASTALRYSTKSVGRRYSINPSTPIARPTTTSAVMSSQKKGRALAVELQSQRSSPWRRTNVGNRATFSYNKSATTSSSANTSQVKSSLSKNKENTLK